LIPNLALYGYFVLVNLQTWSSTPEFCLFPNRSHVAFLKNRYQVFHSIFQVVLVTTTVLKSTDFSVNGMQVLKENVRVA